jgi:hypothetical protein
LIFTGPTALEQNTPGTKQWQTSLPQKSGDRLPTLRLSERKTKTKSERKTKTKEVLRLKI